MAHVVIDSWWVAREMPLSEIDWRNIRLYCGQEGDPFKWERCLYLIRLAPPFAIWYGDDEEEIVSPLVYVGSGNIKQRWSSHRSWLAELGDAIPGGRYEVWVTKPRSTNNAAIFKDIEADILVRFHEKFGYLPLRNLKIEGNPRLHTYEDRFSANIYKRDRRYTWAIYPIRGTPADWYERGSTE